MTSDPPGHHLDLGEAFRARQRQLEANLGFGRTVAQHPDTLGDATELDWRGMLADFLPRRYGVAKAFVVDVHGNVSDQIDVVIHDRQYSPLLFEVGGSRFIPAESVYAVFEIKQRISKRHVEYAGTKIVSVRRLTRTNVGFPTANGEVRQPPPLKPILGGLLCLDSTWTPLFGPALDQALNERSTTEAIDLCCVLRAGAFEAPDPSRPGESLSTCDDPGIALMFFALRLLKRLQDMGTAPAMDLDQYTRAIWPVAESTIR